MPGIAPESTYLRAPSESCNWNPGNSVLTRLKGPTEKSTLENSVSLTSQECFYPIHKPSQFIGSLKICGSFTGHATNHKLKRIILVHVHTYSETFLCLFLKTICLEIRNIQIIELIIASYVICLELNMFKFCLF